MPEAHEEIDDTAYEAGKAAFAAGATLRSVVERMLVEDVTVVSFAIGFADAFIDRLRKL